MLQCPSTYKTYNNSGCKYYHINSPFFLVVWWLISLFTIQINSKGSPTMNTPTIELPSFHSNCLNNSFNNLCKIYRMNKRGRIIGTGIINQLNILPFSFLFSCMMTHKFIYNTNKFQRLHLQWILQPLNCPPFVLIHLIFYYQNTLTNL